MKPFLENIFTPDDPFPAKAFITASMEHVIQVHPHWHTVVEILYYMHGCALQQVNDVFFTAGPGDIVVIGKDQLHSTYTIGRNNCRILVVQFDADRVYGPAGNDPARAVFRQENAYRNPIASAEGSGMRILQCLQAIADELSGGAVAYRCMVKSALFLLAGLLARAGLHDEKPGHAVAHGNVRFMLERTFQLVDESFADEITLADAANASNLSTTHFCRLFRQATGMTFHGYLTFYRINRSEKMLDSRKKLTEVAFDCGFGSVSSFLRNFRRYKGCAPSEYPRSSQ